VAVGAVRALRASDAIVSTYREHGHAIARGIPARAPPGVRGDDCV
jgi:pyruvate dehydrogenase E1 component alpha subunit